MFAFKDVSAKLQFQMQDNVLPKKSHLFDGLRSNLSPNINPEEWVS